MFDKQSFDKGLRYLNQPRVEKAIPLFKTVLRHFECKEGHLNLGNCYKIQGKYELAAQHYLAAANASIPMSDGTFPEVYPIALNNLGQIFYSLGDDSSAEQCYRTVLRYDPTYAECKFNLSNALLRKLCSGTEVDRKEAWTLYENRFKSKTSIKNDKADLVLWDGFSRVPSIVVLTEQGLGDMVMFSRYFDLLAGFCDEIIIQCHPSLHALFSKKWKVCVNVSETKATHGIPAGNLASVFWTDIPSLPDLGSWDAELLDSDLRIGCVWSGNKHHTNDRNRSTQPGFFRALPGHKYNLNPATAGERGFATVGGGFSLDVLNCLDLVITVDTSIAHVCGALNVPCWVLMPLAESDFRWGTAPASEEPFSGNNVWYPSVTVIRNAGNWPDTFEIVLKLLNEKYKHKIR